MDIGSDPAEKPSWLARVDRPLLVTDGRPVRHRKLAITLSVIGVVLAVLVVNLAARLFGGLGLLIAGVGALV